jgi:hypothetical protein
MHPRLGGVLLAHLSAECNDPERARDRVGESLDRVGYQGLLDVAAQGEPSPRYDVEGLTGAGSSSLQLSLFA